MNSTKKHQLPKKEFKNLFDSFYPSLCIFCNKYVNDLEISKDLVQEVFIGVWEKDIVFNDKDSIKSYLYTSARNKSLDYLKSKQYKTRSPLFEDEINKLEAPYFFTSEVVLEETSRLIANAIGTLPHKCQEIMRLCLKGYKNREISKLLSISENTVKTQKKIAYGKLRTLLKGHVALVIIMNQVGRLPDRIRRNPFNLNKIPK